MTTQNSLPETLYTSEQVRQLDHEAINRAGIPGIQLMKRAGRAAFHLMITRWPSAKKLLVFSGGGNNGGDGYVIAALAAQKNLDVRVIDVSGKASKMPSSGRDSLTDAERARQFAVQEKVTIDDVDTLLAHPEWLDHADIIVDAMMGTGLNTAPREPVAGCIRRINAAPAPVIAVDVPTGVCADSGEVFSEAVEAAVTITFIGVNRGLLTGSAPAYTGTLFFDNLDVPEAVYNAVPSAAVRVTASHFRGALRPRAADANKGRSGHVMIIGGDHGMGGAPAMAAESCLRCGAGLTSVATQPEHINAILARLPEVMVAPVPSGQALQPLLERPTVLVIGPGLGQTAWSEQMLQQGAKCGLPMVVDADALNLLAQGRVLTQSRRDEWVLTPHPGEAARLLGCDVAQVQRQRFDAALELQKTYGGIIVLKGAGTVITDGATLAVANVGGPSLAVGGTGDVLSGIIGALLAQGVAPFVAAKLAVYIHGKSGEQIGDEHGVIGMAATDMIPVCRKRLNTLINV